MNSIFDDLRTLTFALIKYVELKVSKLARRFEWAKNLSLDILMSRRGAFQKHIWHGGIIGLALVGLLTSGVFGGQSLVSSSYPGIGGPDPRFVDSFEPFPNGLFLDETQDTHTNISIKPRSEIEEYEIKEGDTISSIAKNKGISIDTIKWANDLTSDTIKPGQTLRILPVSGVSYVVKSGDTLESVAKKYQAESQAILDFPYNGVPDDFKLKIGQLLIIPDGVPEKAKTPVRPSLKYLTQGPSSPVFAAPGGASFIWPTSGGVTQYFAWYHAGVDIANRGAPGVSASDGGVVVVAGWPDNYGYGNRVVIDHGNGYRSMYAHLSNVYVSVGQTISRGQVIGQMGSTGRSTGIHLHLEIHFKGVPVNPLAILK